MPRLTRCVSLFGLALLVASMTVSASAMRLVVVGGGKLNDTIFRELLSLSRAKDPRVLIIPQAARPKNLESTIARNQGVFARLGVKHVEVLDLSDPQVARAAIERADVFWMPGGLQTLLARALQEAGVLETLRSRVMAGVPIGGTSAGAAVMAHDMIIGTDRGESGDEMHPRFGRGFGFWPEAIIDQHFSQRRRVPRLQEAVRKHPHLVGVGIDEETAVVYDGRSVRVIGEHTVTIMRTRDAGPAGGVETIVLRSGEQFDFAAFRGDAAGQGASSKLAGAIPGPIDPVAAWCDRVLPALMKRTRVPGVSVAVVRQHELAWLGQYGVKSVEGNEPVDRDTLFEAASMSKPMFAYVVLQLAQEGRLDLDRPLVEYLGEPYANADPRHDRITARMVLTHTSGFPNWRPGGWRAGGPLPVHFEPGTAQRYSGEGFLFLQRVVEKTTGTPLATLMRRRLLDPLGLRLSGYVWRDEWAANAAAGHTREGRLPKEKRSLYHTANAAFTLYTTPAEYASFLIEMMRPERDAAHSLKREWLAAMMMPHPVANKGTVQAEGDEEDGVVRYGLGWRVEESSAGLRVFHSGSNRTGFRCYAEFYPETGDGLVIMTNAVGGRALWMELTKQLHEQNWTRRRASR